MHSMSASFIFSTNEKRYVEHNSICEKSRRSAEIIIKFFFGKLQVQLDLERIFLNSYLI